jgi:hypothetical protein
VFAVGHPGRTEASDLFSAVLFAGPNASLCGLTAGLWRGLVKWRTAPAIEISTPRRCRSLPAGDAENRLSIPIHVRDRRNLPRAPYHGVPTVPIAHIVRDLATTGDVELVRFVLSQLDYMRCFNPDALLNVCGSGIHGSSVVRDAIGRHQPLLARARSPAEIRLVTACELTGIPLPELNVKLPGITPDAVWRDQMVAVECDGEQNHGTWRQRKRDIERESRSSVASGSCRSATRTSCSPTRGRSTPT